MLFYFKGRSKVIDDPEGVNMPWTESQSVPLDNISTMSSNKIILCSLVIIVCLIFKWFEKI
jgi:hypothetical protein